MSDAENRNMIKSTKSIVTLKNDLLITFEDSLNQKMYRQFFSIVSSLLIVKLSCDTYLGNKNL